MPAVSSNAASEVRNPVLMVSFSLSGEWFVVSGE